MRIQVRKEVCVGSGQCVFAAPDVFDQDDNGLVELVVAEPVAGHHDAVRYAAQLCPAMAIEVEE
ncbi:ferredoxin [Nocardia sp. NPDC051570]|uniref:ferredoxin n=1 Tax=Nocardia sp. NPDC051570 TaxID=3364324 RepID=UPI0037AE22E6